MALIHTKSASVLLSSTVSITLTQFSLRDGVHLTEREIDVLRVLHKRRVQECAAADAASGSYSERRLAHT